ncbi:Histidinol-phosphate aminotransferase [Methanimicrococcus sp. At1]|uniref:Histidinol-phosphate aminotransferase n=1 Tax=Methanimicrococcus hacksteinii TaxID=3028293 RepID=A0ABU3VN40_9EURY|nr:aminotransferase class I/II-fold pyridoxal phosphate-dependent enzyme [Methanimicrococcus sp. At1]MDV0444776.1 Histidinol-phosphate aminotransferase [Methanimicrococcus sp. At1]
MSQNPLKKHIQSFQGCLHGGLIKESAEKYGLSESEILDFSANLNPFKTPFDHPEYGLDFLKIAAESYPDSYNYPDNRYIPFREAAAAFINTGIESDTRLTKENIIPGNGSTEIIRLFCQCVLNEGDKVIIPYPTFGEYEIQCRLQNVEIVYIPQEQVGTLTAEELKEIGAKILFICNPNNPIAALRTREELIKLAEICEKSETVLFMDEAFIELSDPQQSVADLAKDHKFVFIMRSLTKCFEIPGIRLGFGIAQAEIAEALNNARLSWNLSPLQEKTAVALLSMDGGANSDYLKKSRDLILKEANFLKDELSKIWGFKPGAATTNFLLVDISERTIKSTELAERFAKNGILIRNCISFRGLGEDYIRIAVRTRPENEKFIQTISVVFDEWAKDFADNELKSALMIHKTGRQQNKRETCEYYPCHFEGQDCTFCYCPFYPCGDDRGGGKYIQSSKGGQVWSCVDCYIPHISPVVEKMMEGLMEEDETEEILKKEWEEIILPIMEERDSDQVLALCRKIKEENDKNPKPARKAKGSES